LISILLFSNLFIRDLFAPYTLAEVTVAEPQVVLQRVFTPIKPMVAKIAKPANANNPIW
jgi:hypothetical protein